MKTRNNLIRLLSPMTLALALLTINLTGCRLDPGTSPATTADNRLTGPTGATSLFQPGTQPTASPTTKTPGVTTASPSTASPSTAGPSTAGTMKPTTTAGDPLNLSNAKVSWWYTAGAPTGQDRPATIPDAARKLVDRYDAVWQKPEPGRKVVYLTFDEGYEFQNNTTSILDTVRVKQVPAAFFITGSYLRHNPDLVRRMVNDGHLVASHTDSHPNLPDLADSGGPAAVLDELRILDRQYRDLTGQTLTPLVRPPAGSYSERVLAILHQGGYRAVFWSFAYQDWLTDNQPDPAAARKKILDQLHEGSVILLHAVSNTNTAILPDLIDAIRARGYDFGVLR